MNPTFLKTGELRHVEEAQEEDEQGWRWRCAGVSRRTQEVDHVCAANDANRVVEDDRNCWIEKKHPIRTCYPVYVLHATVDTVQLGKTFSFHVGEYIRVYRDVGYT